MKILSKKQVMMILKKLIRAGKVYSKYIFNSIIETCAPSILKCYLRIQSNHIHKQHTIDFILDISTNCYFQEDLNSRYIQNIYIYKMCLFCIHIKNNLNLSFQ